MCLDHTAPCSSSLTPLVPQHYANNRDTGKMKVGQTFTIEPMINAGREGADHWPDNVSLGLLPSPLSPFGRRLRSHHRVATLSSAAHFPSTALPLVPELFL